MNANHMNNAQAQMAAQQSVTPVPAERTLATVAHELALARRDIGVLRFREAELEAEAKQLITGRKPRAKKGGAL